MSKPHMRAHFILPLLVGVLAVHSIPTAVAAQEMSKRKAIEFDHEGCAVSAGTCRAAYVLELRNDEQFEIRIKNTDKANLLFDIAGVLAARPSQNAPQAAAVLGDTTFVLTHDKKYGGYLVNMRAKPNATSQLPDATLMITVRTDQWVLGFAGGFPVSTLTDKRFALRDTTISGEKQSIVKREASNEDDLNLATATFIHVSHTSKPGWGLSFGVGIGGSASYYAGVSRMFGDVGSFTVGPVFGTRKDLPTGVRINDLTSNANLLANLSDRNRIGIFAAFSFTFLGNERGALEKPFKGNETAAGAAAAGGNAGEEREALDEQTKFALSLTAADSAKVGEPLELRLEIKGPERSLVDGTLSVEKVSGSIDLPGNSSVVVKAAEDGKVAMGTISTKVTATEAKSFTVTLKITGQGIHARPVTSRDITVKPK